MDPELWNSVKLFTLRLGFAGAILTAFWILGMIVGRLVDHVGARTGADRQPLIALGARIAEIAVRVLGCVTALGTIGVDISALVAGLGLTGFALSFAMKDALSNVLAGAMILFYRPFTTGSRIAVAGFQGDVIQIDLRYTRLRSPEQDVLLPNSTLLTTPIVVLAKRKSGGEDPES